MGIMENKMETIMGWIGFRASGLRWQVQVQD